MATSTLILPGIYNSGPRHWQSIWESANSDYMRIDLGGWGSPRCDQWVRRLDEAITAVGKNVVLVAHSSSCSLVAHWWMRGHRVVHGALLVAPSDTEAPTYPVGPEGFAPMPLCRLPFRTILVASEDDPAVSFERARLFADVWGSEFINVGAAGHIDESSGFGPWPEGRLLLERLHRQSEYC